MVQQCSQVPFVLVTDGSLPLATSASGACEHWRTTRWPTTIDQTLRHSLPRVISQARLNLSECHRDCALCIAVSRCTFPYIWFLLLCHLSLRLYCFVGLIIVVIKLSQRSRSSLHDKTAIQRAQSRWHSTITVWPGHRGRSHRPNTTGPSMPHQTATQTLWAWNGAMGYLSPPPFTLLHSVRLPDWGGWRTTRWPTTVDQTLRHSLPRVISQARLNLSECHRDCALCIAVSRCTFPYIWFLLLCHLALRLYCFVGLIIVVIKLSQRSRSSLQTPLNFIERDH